MIRYSMWLIAMAILIFELVLNSNYSASPVDAPFTSRFTFKGIPFDIYEKPDVYSKDGARPFDWQDAADFFPPCILSVIGLYIGISLWRFGTFISTDIWTTSLNPWISVLLATLIYFFVWLFTPRSWMYPYIMNAAYLVLLIALVITVGLVEANFRTLEAWEKTLENTNETTLANEVRKETEAQFRENSLADGLVPAKDKPQRTTDTNASSDAYPLHIKFNNDFTGIQLTSPRTIESLQKLEPYPPRDPEHLASSESSGSRVNLHPAAAAGTGAGTSATTIPAHASSSDSIVAYENPDFRPGRSVSPRRPGGQSTSPAGEYPHTSAGAGASARSRYLPTQDPPNAMVPAPVPGDFSSPTVQPMLRGQQQPRTDVEDIQASPTYAEPSRRGEYTSAPVASASSGAESSHSPHGPPLQSRSAMVQGRDPRGYTRQQLPKESYPSIRNDVYPYHSLSYYANQKRPIPSGASAASTSMGDGNTDRSRRGYPASGRGSIYNSPPGGHNRHGSSHSYIDEAIQPPGNLPPY